MFRSDGALIEWIFPVGVWRGGGDWWFAGVRQQWHGSGFLPWVAVFFFFFLVLTVDYGLLVVVVVVVSGVCSVAVVAIVVLEQKEREKE